MPPIAQPLCWHAYHLPKRGNSAEEYEDAFAGSPERGRFAVADGASESSFAAPWAGLLTEGFIEADYPWAGTEWLEPLRRRWAAEVGGRALPWYAEMKRNDGAAATLLGLALRRAPEDDRPGSWRAVAVGDSCLFQLRQSKVVTAFPLTRSDEFGSSPSLLLSRPSLTGEPPAIWYQARGEWRPGDHFLLMTDALAQWFLAQLEHKHDPLPLLRGLPGSAEPMSAFADLVAELRQRQGLRNDDVTLVLAEAGVETPPPKE
jgi:hypothetical protein